MLLPTLWGVIVMTAIAIVIITAIVKQLGFILAKNAPIDGQILIVEGWLDEHALLKAKAIFEQSEYQLLITSGGPDTGQLNPDYDSYAEKAAVFLINQGLNKQFIKAIPAPASAQNRTFLSAVMVRDWLTREYPQINRLDVVSLGVHARRTQQLYQTAFDDTASIGIYAVNTKRYRIDQWWKTTEGLKAVLAEVLGIGYNLCCFDPGEKHSHQERWGNYSE